MKRVFRVAAVLCLFAAAAALAQTPPFGYVNVTGSNVRDSSGNLLASGTISFAPVNNNAVPISYRATQGQNAQISATVSGGVISSPTIISGGEGYPQNVFITANCTDPPYITATVAGGALTGLTLNFGGTGCPSVPTFTIVGAGQTQSTAVTATVTNGVFSLQLADTWLTSPQNVCYLTTIVDNTTGNQLLGGGYSCVQPSGMLASGAVTGSQPWCSPATGAGGGTCNWDAYVPNATPLLVAANWATLGLQMGTITAVPYGTAPSGTITGTTPNQFLNLNLETGPQGATGATGPTGPQGAAGVSSGGAISSGPAPYPLALGGYPSSGTQLNPYTVNQVIGCPLASTLGLDASGATQSGQKFLTLITNAQAASKALCVHFDLGGTFDFSDWNGQVPNSGGGSPAQNLIEMEGSGLTNNGASSTPPGGGATILLNYTPTANITITAGSISNVAQVVAPEANIHVAGAQGTGFTTGDTITASDCGTNWSGTVTAVTAGGAIKSIALSTGGAGCPSHLTGTDTAWTTSGSGTGAKLYVYSMPVGTFSTTATPNAGQRLMLSSFTGVTNLNGRSLGTVVSANGTTMVVNFPWAVLANTGSTGAGAAAVITGQLDTRGYGVIKIHDLTLKNTANCIPLFFDTNTTPVIFHAVFWGSGSGTSACNDAMRFGGNSPNINATDTAKFNGYFGEVKDNYFFQIQRWADFSTATNAMHFEFNRGEDSVNGNAQQDGAAILLDASEASGDNTDVGNHINFNDLEATAYSRFAVCMTCISDEFNTNNIWDQGGSWAIGYLDLSQAYNSGDGFSRITGGYGPATLFAGPTNNDDVTTLSSNQPNYRGNGGPYYFSVQTNTGLIVVDNNTSCELGVLNYNTREQFCIKLNTGASNTYTYFNHVEPNGGATVSYRAMEDVGNTGAGIIDWLGGTGGASSYFKAFNAGGPLYIGPASGSILHLLPSSGSSGIEILADFNNFNIGATGIVSATGHQDNYTIAPAAGAAAGSSPVIGAASGYRCGWTSCRINLDITASPTTGALYTITDGTTTHSGADANCVVQIYNANSSYVPSGTQVTSGFYSSASTTVETLNITSALSTGFYVIVQVCGGS